MKARIRENHRERCLWPWQLTVIMRDRCSIDSSEDPISPRIKSKDIIISLTNITILSPYLCILIPLFLFFLIFLKELGTSIWSHLFLFCQSRVSCFSGIIFCHERCSILTFFQKIYFTFKKIYFVTRVRYPEVSVWGFFPIYILWSHSKIMRIHVLTWIIMLLSLESQPNSTDDVEKWKE